MQETQEMWVWIGKIPWRRKWQPTLVFFLGEWHGQRSLVGCSPWGRKESDTAEQLNTPECKAVTEWDSFWGGGWFVCGGALALLRAWNKVMNSRREDTLLPGDQEFPELWLGPTLERGFPGGSAVKNQPASARDTGSIPGLRRCPGEVKCQPTPVFLPWKSHGQRSLAGYSPWDHKQTAHEVTNRNPMDRGAWRATAHEVANNWTWLSDWTTTTLETGNRRGIPALEKGWVCLMGQKDSSTR